MRKRGTCQLREGSTENFADPDDYQAGLRRHGIEPILTCAGRFNASLICVEWGSVSLLCSQESLARVAHVKLAPKRAVITFPMDSGVSMIWAGICLRPGDIVFHGLGERMYQRTVGPCRWGAIFLNPDTLATCSGALVERALVPPPFGRVVRPSPSAAARLRRLHKSACRRVEIKPPMAANPEVVRVQDRELIHALVTCLATKDLVPDTLAHRRHAEIMMQFEELLAGSPALLTAEAKLCQALGVSQRNLRICCAEFLGMGPYPYIRLRRMHAAHAALRRANPTSRFVAEVAQQHGFFDPGRFAVEYRKIFGEKPSDSLRHSTGPTD